MQHLFRSMLLLILLALAGCHATPPTPLEARAELVAHLQGPQPRVATYDVHVYGTLRQPATDSILTRIQEEGTSFTARTSMGGSVVDYSFRNGSMTACDVFVNVTRCA